MLVQTVLGPVSADDLGVIAPQETLLSVLPGAQFAFDIDLDRAAIFEELAVRLIAFKTAGGGTVVDSSGMFHGRDLALYEALSRSTGVHIVASTGMGPEELLGGYFLTPQTNPPTPWPAEKFDELFQKELADGMVVPRVERRAPAGLVTALVTRAGRTATDESLVRGAARAAAGTGTAMSLRFGADSIADLQVALDEGLTPDRVVVGDQDRRDAAPLEVAELGAYVALDHVGTETPDHLTDSERVALVADLIAAGHGTRILLSAGATGVAMGHPGNDVPFGQVLISFVPQLEAAGISRDDIQQMLVDNPRELLAVR